MPTPPAAAESCGTPRRDRLGPLARHDRTRRRLDRGYKTLARYLRPLRRVDAAALAGAASSIAGGAAGHRLDHRPSRAPQPGRAERLRAIRVRCPELDAAVRHVAGFARMIT